MTIPHLKYIEALFLSFKTIPQVSKDLDELGLDLPYDVLEVIYTGLSEFSPQTFQEKDADYPTKEFLDEMGIAALWSFLNKFPMDDVETSTVEGAYKLLQDPLMYKIVTSVALVGMTEEDKEFILLSDFNTEYSQEHLEAFLHYFFNIRHWSVKDKKDWIENYSHPELKPVYVDALKQNKDYLFWKLGLKRNLSYKQMIADMGRDSYFLFKEAKSADPQRAQAWGKLAMALADKMNKIDTKDKEGPKGGNVISDIKFQIQTRIGRKYEDETPDSGDKKKKGKSKPPLGTHFKHLNDLKDDDD